MCVGLSFFFCCCCFFLGGGGECLFSQRIHKQNKHLKWNVWNCNFLHFFSDDTETQVDTRIININLLLNRYSWKHFGRMSGNHDLCGLHFVFINQFCRIKIGVYVWCGCMECLCVHFRINFEQYKHIETLWNLTMLNWFRTVVWIRLTGIILLMAYGAQRPHLLAGRTGMTWSRPRAAAVWRLTLRTNTSGRALSVQRLIYSCVRGKSVSTARWHPLPSTAVSE